MGADESRFADALRPLCGARVLVTGATGFIGSALAERLETAGSELHCTARHPEAAAGAGRGPTQATWWPLDLTDRAATHLCIEAVRPDYVYHLASRVDGSRDSAAVAPAFYAESAATVHLLEALLQVDCRRVVCSGSAEVPSDPIEAATVASPYAAAKASSRIYQKLFDQLYGLPVVNARIAMAYGPGQRDERKLVPYVTQSLLQGTSPRLTDGSRRADWVYVEDVVDALMLLATEDAVHGMGIDIGTGVLSSVRDVVERLHRITGSAAAPAYGAIPARPLEQALKADVERTRRLLGWQACTGLDEGLRRTVDFYAAQAIGAGEAVGRGEDR